MPHVYNKASVQRLTCGSDKCVGALNRISARVVQKPSPSIINFVLQNNVTSSRYSYFVFQSSIIILLIKINKSVLVNETYFDQ